MTESRGKRRVVGRLVGLLLVAAAVVSVFVIDWETAVPEPEPQIRPLKTVIAGGLSTSAGRTYPGRVRANQEVKLAFQVAGPLIEFPIKKGEDVVEGALLARVDPRDFQNALDAAEAQLIEAKALWERMERLYKDGHAQEVEYEGHRRSFNVAKTRVEQAKKDLGDTYLRAPFSGVVANTFAENFENVKAKQVILSLQDVSKVEIEVNVPEKHVLLSANKENEFNLIAEFENLPGRRFEVSIKEFVTEADPVTQTFAATVVMVAPKDVTILPGMTAMITARRKDAARSQDAGFVVPVDSVAFDGTGGAHVWLVKSVDETIYTVHRVAVEVGPMHQDVMTITDGIKQGDRIASAGVHLLREGQRVRLLGGQEGGASQ